MLAKWAVRIMLGLALPLCSAPASARTEFREIAWAFCIWDCGNSGDAETADGALGAFNAAVDNSYSQCMASAATNECGGGCYKINRYNLAPSGGFAIINGTSTFQTTQNNIETIFVPACGTRGAEYIVRPSSGGIAVYGKTYCDTANGWSGQVTSSTTITLNGQQTASSKMSCVKDVANPPSCSPAAPARRKPLFSDPISPVDGVQIEAVTDYVDARGTLKLNRNYTSGGGGRWSWGDGSTGLIDFTGRNSGRPVDTLEVSAHLMLIPPGMYYGTTRPDRQPALRSFPLQKIQPDTGTQEVWVSFPDGSRNRYVETAPNEFQSTPYDGRKISVVGDAGSTYTWTLKDEVSGYVVFDNAGSVLSRTSRTGQTVAFARVGSTVTLTDSMTGRSLLLNRPSTGRGFASAVLPDGQTVSYQLGVGGRIDAVTYADGSSKQYVYDETANTSAATSAPFRLTGLIDENGARTATFKYDGGARAQSTERFGGIDKHSVAYNFWAGGGASTVTFPNQSTSTITWDVGPDGESRLLSQTQAAGSGCAASTSAVTYDTNGNVASSNDFNGMRTCYANDTLRNSEVARVEGLSSGALCSSVTPTNATLPIGARKVSTQWHPDWRMPTKVAEPGRITTYVYNGQPDPFSGGAVASCAPSSAQLPDGRPIAVLCRQVEQATTDANGSLGFSATLQVGVVNREQRWTYNQYGQVLTHDGPRTDVSDVTTYTYYGDTRFTGAGSAAVGHTLGDLQSVKGPTGQVTQYMKYDKHGQLLESVDANGVVTTNTYDLRRRLLSSTVGGQAKNYTYDAAGQLKRITRPDGSFVAFDYDAAHRQTAAFDNLGNRIEYTLDNTGNRTAESVKDATGALRRQLARSIDALGRVQQTTGRE